MKKMKKCEMGSSMVEMIGVLAVAGLITIGAFFVVRSVTQSQKISRAQDDVASIASAVIELSAQSPDFSNLSSLTSVSKGKAFLESLRIDTSTPFGEDTYYSVVYNDKYPDVFGIYITGLDEKYCNALQIDAFKNAVDGGCGKGYGVQQLIINQDGRVDNPASRSQKTNVGRVDGGIGVIEEQVKPNGVNGVAKNTFTVFYAK